jgi:hypothetical protein
VGPHVFVDETKERGYLIAAAIIQPENLAVSRRAIRSLIMPRQRRIHFKGEGEPRRRKIVDTLIDLGVRAMLYDASTCTKKKQARDSCLVRLVGDLKEMNAVRLVLEFDNSTCAPDQALLNTQVRAVGLAGVLRYEHLRAYEECLLAAPDAIAWCWARGGYWRARIREIVQDVRDV